MSGGRRRWAALAAAGVAAGLLVACGGDEADTRRETAGMPSTRQAVEAHEWVLVGDDSSRGTDDAEPVTLSVRADVVSGTAPCNTYRGSIALDGDHVEITDIARTLRACPEPTMAAEDELVAALEAVDTVEVSGDDDDRLVLSNDDGVRLAFRSYDADELLPGTWEIVDVGRGDQLSSVVAGTEPTVTFDPAGTVVLATGCNTASGSWALDGGELAVEPMRLTRKFCAEPEGVMDQEAALVAALEAAARVEVAPGSLTILDADGVIAVVATDR
jgi:heat shock protein HslJ